MSTPEERAWEVVRRAYEERPPAPPRPRRIRARTLAALVALAVAGAVLSPSGQAVLERVRRTVGIGHAAPVLVALPSPGRLLVVSPKGASIVDSDGARHRLGSFTDADWSPHGLYVVATRRNELVALDPQGKVHWTLARRGPAWPRWTGTYTDTRIAYVSAGGLHVVAGDGTGDRLLAADAGDAPPAWDPARRFAVAYASAGAILLRRDDGTLLWRRPVPALPHDLSWSSDGRELAVFGRRAVVVLDGRGRLLRTIRFGGLVDGAFEPGSHRLAVSVRLPGRSEVRLVDGSARRLLLAGPGAFGELAWSPDGRWLLVTWPAADQWVFVHGTRARAVARIRAQFQQGPLQVAGRWCCAR